MEPPWDGGTKVCSNGPGHMTKMATMPISGKNLMGTSLGISVDVYSGVAGENGGIDGE